MLGLPSAYHNDDLHRVPFCYCFSPTLVPRPSDWPQDLVDIAGFFALGESKSNYKPPPDLVAFLADKDKPVYFGFGSLVVDKPQVSTRCPLFMYGMLTQLIQSSFAPTARQLTSFHPAW